MNFRQNLNFLDSDMETRNFFSDFDLLFLTFLIHKYTICCYLQILSFYVETIKSAIFSEVVILYRKSKSANFFQISNFYVEIRKSVSFSTEFYIFI